MAAKTRGAIQVFIAVPSTAVARRIAASLLDARLCACAQTLGPVQSRYLWKGKPESAREWLLLVKTRAALYEGVEREVRRLHPYEVPEILAVPVAAGLGAYLGWLQRETRPPKTRRARRASGARATGAE